METTKRITFILILILLITGTIIPAEPKISDTRTASCLLKITSDPAILPLDDTTIDYLLHSSGVAGKAAREILEVQLSEESMQEAITTEWLADESDMMSLGAYGGNTSPEENMTGERPDYEREIMQMQEMEGMENPYQTRRPVPARSTGRRMMIGEPLNVTYEQTILLRLAVNIDEGIVGKCKPAAEEFMKAIITNLDETLRGAYNKHMQRLQQRLELAQEEASRTEHELQNMQKGLRNIAGSRILDKDRILGEIMDKRHNLQDTRMDMESDKVIIEEITKRIAETQTKLKEQITTDEVIKELQQLMESQMRQMEEAKLQVKNGVISPSDLAEAERKLARARIELAQRRGDLNRSSGGNLIESLNRELAERTMRAAQNEVKITGLTRQLAEAEELLNKTDDHELLILKAEIARQNLREALVWRDRISRKIRLIQPPAVSVLGGD